MGTGFMSLTESVSRRSQHTSAEAVPPTEVPSLMGSVATDPAAGFQSPHHGAAMAVMCPRAPRQAPEASLCTFPSCPSYSVLQATLGAF